MSSPFRTILSFLLILFAPVILAAQANYTAQLSGTVTDSSGGAVTGAKVIVTDDATNIAVTAVTDESGLYVVTGLRPARYTLRVEANNFATVERKNLILAVNQRATV